MAPRRRDVAELKAEMMVRKNFLLVLTLLLLMVLPVKARYVDSEVHRGGTITVMGTATVEVVPDEVHLFVTIKEYYAEELAGETDPKEFKTKVGLAEIDKELARELVKLKVSAEMIATQNVGSRWREMGREYLKSKQYDIRFSSFSEAERVADGLSVRGVESIYMGDLSNRQLPAMREKGKIEALLAARRKAEALVKALGKKLGDVVEIVEPEDQGYDVALDEAAAMQSNAKFAAGSAGAMGGRRQRMIPLRYAIRATFRIE